jgi:hypothetical protein
MEHQLGFFFHKHDNSAGGIKDHHGRSKTILVSGLVQERFLIDVAGSNHKFVALSWWIVGHGFFLQSWDYGVGVGANARFSAGSETA